MPNDNYWEKRFTLLNKNLMSKGEDFARHSQQSYIAVMNEIEKDINNFYMRFANENKITLQQAKQILTSSERRAFQMTLEDYIKYGRQNNLSPEWIRKLKNASTVHRITKLQAIQFQFRQQIEKLESSKLQGLTNTLKDVYKEGYYKTAYEIQKGTGIGQAFSKIDKDKIEKVLARPWAADGKHFSDRIWKDKAQLIHQLDTRFTQGIIRGDAPQAIIKDMAKALQVSEYSVKRLVLTETAFITAATRKDVFDRLGVKKYKISAALSYNTCEYCGSLDGKIFETKDFKIGVTAHPFHPNCRCTEVPYYDDNFLEGKQRAAKDENNKTYFVPASMDYNEWRNKYVKNDSESFNGLKKTDKNDTIKENKNSNNAPKQNNKRNVEKLKIENFPKAFIEETEINNTKTFVDYINNLENADTNVISLFNNMSKLENIESKGIPFKISHEGDHSLKAFRYRTTGNIAEVELIIPKLQGNNIIGQINTTLHEEMHLIDFYGRQNERRIDNYFSTTRKPLMDIFQKSICSIGIEVQNLFREYNKEFENIQEKVDNKYLELALKLKKSNSNNYNQKIEELKNARKNELDYLARNCMGGGIDNLQDIYDALSGGAFRDNKIVVYGHGVSYYVEIEKRVKETLANYAALSITRPDLIDLLRADKPELVEELEKTIIELLKKAGGK